jgi:hypothetical protein
MAANNYLYITIRKREVLFMTREQVAYTLNKIGGYPIDSWTGIDDITIIAMSQDTNLLTNPKAMRFKFNTDLDVLEISYGTIELISGTETYVSSKRETSNYTPESFVPFSAICGFITSVDPGHQGTYYRKSFGGKVDYRVN